jgi:ectoine hydroxylase-related dioxygenase (phytanoyl-CoA dioxygenase family)
VCARLKEWHADGPHTAASMHPATQGSAPSRPAPYAICVFVPLIDLTHETGFTQFWPGTHHAEHLLGFGGAAQVLQCTADAACTAGSAVLYDYRVLHRGMPNVSAGTRRDVVQVVYHRKDYQETRNYRGERLWKDL